MVCMSEHTKVIQVVLFLKIQPQATQTMAE